MPDLVKELAFYRRYHYNSVNVGIHIVCIPLILLSIMWLVTAVRIPPFLLQHLPDVPAYYYPYFNLSVLNAIGYGAYYSILDPIYGIPAAIGLLTAAKKFTDLQPVYGSEGNKVAWAVHVISWIAQFIGHGQFEHRAPALLDSLHQALVSAPFFALIELMHVLGFRRHILDDIDKQVLPEIQKFHATRKAKSS